jgi:carbon monoxide dehydrogenase subunit G
MELTNDFRVGVPVERAWEVLTDVELIAPCMPGAQLQEIEGDEFRGVVKVKVGPITAQYKGKATFVERDDDGHKAVLRAEGRETRGQGNASATITAKLTPEGEGTAVSVVTDLTVTGRVAQFGRGVMADVSTKLLGQFVDCLEGKLAAGEVGAASGGPGSAGAGGPGSAGGPADTAAVSAGSAPASPPGGGGAGAEGGHGPLDIASEGAAASREIEAAGERAIAAAANGARSDGERGRSPASSSGVRVVDSPDAEPVDLLDAAGAPVAKRALPVVAGLTVLWLLSVFLRRRRRKR